MYSIVHIRKAIISILKNRLSEEIAAFYKTSNLTSDEILTHLIQSLHKYRIIETVEHNYSVFWIINEKTPDVWSGVIRNTLQDFNYSEQ